MADNDVPRIYANWLAFATTPFDLSVDFGYVERHSDDPPQPEWLTRVVLSWEEVVVLQGFLDRHVALYEEHVGSIRRWDGPPPVIEADSNGSPEPEEPDDE
ncbi:MAG: DUF3467 domain-containing protein [Actinomycetota bacterium]|nr:DUF3467 domain-containing protein [Actinomycetota bacterium]